MSCEIILPQLGFSMTEGDLVEWLVPDGTKVTEGQMVLAVEADKATQEVPSPGSGTLRIVAAPGETYQVGALLGYID